jgi:hypothetical protein
MPRFTHMRLARHTGIWRVDGIGPIEDRGSQLGLRAVVHFSGLTEVGLRDPYSKLSRNGKSLKLPVHSASIREFRVGSIWRDGKRIFGARPLKKLFRIDGGRVRLVELDQEVDLSGLQATTVVPDSYLNLGETNRKHLSATLYAIVPVLGDSRTQWLVVPATELVRFYSGVSSRFMSSALRGRLDDYIHWARSRIDNETPILHIPQRLSRKEAMVLARAVASAPAKASLLGVHQNLATTQANNASSNDSTKRPLIVKANFPFNDTTELQVAGKLMLLVSEGGREQWAIFAMEILTCSHPPGFDRFILEGGDPVIQGARDNTGSGMPPPTHNPLFEEDEDDYEVDDVPADKRLNRLVTRSFTNQFTGFNGLKIEHRRPRIERPENEFGSHINVLVNTLTTEDGSHSDEAKGNLGISDFQCKIAEVDHGLALFINMLKHLRAAMKSKSWTVTTRKLEDGIPLNGEWIARFPMHIGKRRRWHIIGDAEHNKRPRQVAWVEVLQKDTDQYFNLFEMELKQGEQSTQCTILMHVKDFTSLDEQMFHEWLVLTAIQNRWPDQHNKWSDSSHDQRAKALFAKVQAYRIHHPYSPRAKVEEERNHKKCMVSPEAWSKCLIEKISELLPQF